jgi:hypothetical protein
LGVSEIKYKISKDRRNYGSGGQYLESDLKNGK